MSQLREVGSRLRAQVPRQPHRTVRERQGDLDPARVGVGVGVGRCLMEKLEDRFLLCAQTRVARDTAHHPARLLVVAVQHLQDKEYRCHVRLYGSRTSSVENGLSLSSGRVKLTFGTQMTQSCSAEQTGMYCGTPSRNRIAGDARSPRCMCGNSSDARICFGLFLGSRMVLALKVMLSRVSRTVSKLAAPSLAQTSKFEQCSARHSVFTTEVSAVRGGAWRKLSKTSSVPTLTSYRVTVANTLATSSSSVRVSLIDTEWTVASTCGNDMSCAYPRMMEQSSSSCQNTRPLQAAFGIRPHRNRGG
eukprot:2147557-Rhodomonas_salina.1